MRKKWPRGTHPQHRSVITLHFYQREIIDENVKLWKSQEKSFNNKKVLLTKYPILKSVSTNGEIVIQCDSSKDGLNLTKILITVQKYIGRLQMSFFISDGLLFINKN